MRFVHQRGRFISAIVRPLVWLFIFAAGFRQILGVSIIPPYDTYVLYDVYVSPGLVAMIQLFNGMQSSLSMVYDREMGNMRMLLVSPFPRWYLLLGKLLASTSVSLLQVFAYLVIAWLWGSQAPPWGYVAVIPALVLSGMMMGSLGMLLSSGIKQLENFAGVMNFVIFPMFFASSALYPLWLVQQSSPVVYLICRLNPFTYAVELIRFALYLEVDWVSLAVVSGATIVFTLGGFFAYDPARGLVARRGGPGMIRLTLISAPFCCAPRKSFAQPPGARIPTGHVSRSRFRNFPWRRSGRARGDPRTPAGRTIPQSQTWCSRLAPRRVPMEQAHALMHDFAQQAGDQKQAQLLQLLVGLFSVLDQERGSVIAGLDRFGGRQKELAARDPRRQRETAGTAGGCRIRPASGPADDATSHLGGRGLPGSPAGHELRL